MLSGGYKFVCVWFMCATFFNERSDNSCDENHYLKAPLFFQIQGSMFFVWGITYVAEIGYNPLQQNNFLTLPEGAVIISVTGALIRKKLAR